MPDPWRTEGWRSLWSIERTGSNHLHDKVFSVPQAGDVHSNPQAPAEGVTTTTPNFFHMVSLVTRKVLSRT